MANCNPDAFVQKHLRDALLTAIKYNIPAGGILAVGAHESGCGTSARYRRISDPFGMTGGVPGSGSRKTFEQAFKDFGEMIHKRYRHVVGLQSPVDFVNNPNSRASGYIYAENPPRTSTVKEFLRDHALYGFDTMYLNPLRNGERRTRPIEVDEVKLHDVGALHIALLVDKTAVKVVRAMLDDYAGGFVTK